MRSDSPLAISARTCASSNVLVSQVAGSIRVCPIDWEMAALGPSLMDVAALIAGRWPNEQREKIVAAYEAALPDQASAALSTADRAQALVVCRLHLAIQWLGWSSSWSPPAEHVYDWFEEGLRLADQLIG